MRTNENLASLIREVKNKKVTFLFFMLLILTQIYITIPNDVTLSGMTKVYIANILIFGYAAYFVLYRLLYKNEFKKLSRRSRYVFWSVVLFGVYLLFSYLYRAFVQDNTSVSLAMTQTILLSSIFFLITDLERISFEELFEGIAVFVLGINVIVMTIIVVFNTSLRKVPILGNVNIYIGFLLLVTPLLLAYYHKKYHIQKYRILFYFTLISMTLGLIFTGSRFSFVYYIFELLLTYIIIQGFTVTWLRIKNFTLLLLGVIIITALFSSSDPVIKEDIARTFSIPKQIVSLVINTGSSEGLIDSINKDIIPDNELPSDDPDAPVESMTRSWLFGQTLHEIESNYILGKGTHAVFLRGWGYQSPHNFILEIILCYGILGGVIYSAIAFYPIVLMIVYRKRKTSALLLVGYLSVFLFSMVEPLLADKLVILLPLWALSGSLYTTPNAVQND